MFSVEAFSGPAEAALGTLSDGLYNALSDVTGRFVPEVGVIRRELLENGAEAALMTGSGSSVYGLFESRKTAENALLKAASGNEACLTETTPNGITEIPAETF